MSISNTEIGLACDRANINGPLEIRVAPSSTIQQQHARTKDRVRRKLTRKWGFGNVGIYAKKNITFHKRVFIHNTQKCANIKCVTATRLLTPPKIRFGIQDPLLTAVGGDPEFLDQIHSILTNQSKRPIKNNGGALSKLQIIWGPPASGKTEWIRKYVSKFSNFYHHIIWIPAQSQQSMMTSFLSLIEEEPVLSPVLKIVEKMDKTNIKNLLPLIQNIYEIICRKKTLIIFDDAECPRSWSKTIKTKTSLDTKEETRTGPGEDQEPNQIIEANSKIPTASSINDFLPASLPPNVCMVPAILITSTDKTGWGPLAKKITSLPPWTVDEGIRFLLNQLSLDTQDENQHRKSAHSLVTLLCAQGKNNFWSPSELVKAIKFIKEKNELAVYSSTGEIFLIQNYVDMFLSRQ